MSEEITPAPGSSNHSWNAQTRRAATAPATVTARNRAMYGRRPRCKRKSDYSAKRSGSVMYSACFHLNACLIGRGLCRPDISDRCPQPDDACQGPHSRCKNPLAAADIRPYRCTINMYLICMCWLRGSDTAKIGRDPGQRNEAEKAATSTPKFGVHPRNPDFPLAFCYRLGAIQR